MKKFKNNSVDSGIKPPDTHSIRNEPDEICRTLFADVLEIINTSIELEESCRRILSIVKTLTGCESAAIRFKNGNDYPYDGLEAFSIDGAVPENSLLSNDSNENYIEMEGGRIPKACFCDLVLSAKNDLLLTPGGSYWTNNSGLLKDLSPADDPRHRSCRFCSNRNYSSMAVIPIRSRHDIIGLMHINGLQEGLLNDKVILCLEGIAAQIGLVWLWKKESKLSDEKVDKAYAELDVKVEQRTKDLSDANEILRMEITARRQLEMEKEKNEAQHQQLLKAESLGCMAGSIAHKFNNLLCVVVGNIELVSEELPLGSKAGEFLADARIAANNASEISRMMLSYLGHVTGCHEIHDISQICHQMIGKLRSIIPKRIDIIADIPPSGPMVRGSNDQIEQILGNLTTNSWEAIGDSPGYINLAVKTVSHKDIPWQNRFPLDWEPRKKHYACLEVSDSGCGIDPDEISRIFDPFFTRKTIGRGLGLPVALGIIRAHHGAITVESQSGYGSVFRFFLPVSPNGIPKHLKTLSPMFESDTGYTNPCWLKANH